MAPPREPVYSKDEKVLCFHHELLYEAKVLDSRLSDPDDRKSPPQYRVHYKGWKNTWDDWVPQDRLRKLNEENKQLAQNLKNEMDDTSSRAATKASAKKKKTAGSDLSSARGSEDRQSVPPTGRGQKRGRENEIEKVRNEVSYSPQGRKPKDSRKTLSPGPSGQGSGTRRSTRNRKPTEKAISGYDVGPPSKKARTGRNPPQPTPNPQHSGSEDKTPIIPTENAPQSSKSSVAPSNRVNSTLGTIQEADETEAPQTTSEDVEPGPSQEAPQTTSERVEPEPSQEAPQTTSERVEPGPSQEAPQTTSERVEQEKSHGGPSSSTVTPRKRKATTQSGTPPSPKKARHTSQEPGKEISEEAQPVKRNRNAKSGPVTSKSTKKTPKHSNKYKGKARRTTPEPSANQVFEIAKVQVVDPAPADESRGSSSINPRSAAELPSVYERTQVVASAKNQQSSLAVDTRAQPQPSDAVSGNEAGPSRPSAQVPKEQDEAHDDNQNASQGIDDDFWAKESAAVATFGPQKTWFSDRPSSPNFPKHIEYDEHHITSSGFDWNASQLSARFGDRKPTPDKDDEEGDEESDDKGAQKPKPTASRRRNKNYAKLEETVSSLQSKKPKALGRGTHAPIEKKQKKARQHERYYYFLRTDPKNMERFTFYQEAELDARAVVAGFAPESPPEDLIKNHQVKKQTYKDGHDRAKKGAKKTRKEASKKGPEKETKGPDPEEPKETDTEQPKGTETIANDDIEQEEQFNARPAVKLEVSDNLKALLVDDWENVTKNLTLLPVPSEHPASEILDTYFHETKHKRRLGSAEAELLEEVVQGMKEYFNKCLGKILLYRFEREQYAQVCLLVEKEDPDFKDKTMADIYGAEHLCRLFVSLPELIAQTNMDVQSVIKLRSEVQKLTTWLGKNSARFFTAEYETQTPEYREKIRADLGLSRG